MADRDGIEKHPARGGLEIRQAHYPGRAPIEAYGAGGFRFAGMSHRGSILCLPSGIHSWDIASPQEFGAPAFAQVFAESGSIEVLLIGTGREIVPIGEALRAALRECRIMADAMSTGAAVRTFNVLLAEGRAVAAALLAIE